MKTCTKCKIEKQPTDFTHNRQNRDGLSSWCRTCSYKASAECNKRRKQTDNNFRQDCNKRTSTYIRSRRHTDPEFSKRWNESSIRLKRKKHYNITPEQYDQMLTEQNGVCKICGKVDNNGRSLAVDHDHQTGQVRGLLCSDCNTAIGLLHDNTTLLLSAIDYLTRGIS